MSPRRGSAWLQPPSSKLLWLLFLLFFFFLLLFFFFSLRVKCHCPAPSAAGGTRALLSSALAHPRRWPSVGTKGPILSSALISPLLALLPSASSPSGLKEGTTNPLGGFFRERFASPPRAPSAAVASEPRWPRRRRGSAHVGSLTELTAWILASRGVRHHREPKRGSTALPPPPPAPQSLPGGLPPASPCFPPCCPPPGGFALPFPLPEPCCGDLNPADETQRGRSGWFGFIFFFSAKPGSVGSLPPPASTPNSL